MKQPTSLLLVLLSAAGFGSVATAAEVTFESVNGVSDTSNYYVGPYSLRVDGTLYQTMCYDFTHPVEFNQTWTANLLSFDHLEGAYYSSDPNYVSKYWQEAWLFNQLLQAATPEAMIGIQHAAWMLFNPDVAPSDGSAPWLDAASDALQNHPDDLNLSAFRVINGTDERPTVQGFIIKQHSGFEAQDGGEVPEARTFLLLATGLLAFSFVPKRLRRIV